MRMEEIWKESLGFFRFFASVSNFIYGIYTYFLNELPENTDAPTVSMLSKSKKNKN
jgi:hypothetical protein